MIEKSGHDSRCLLRTMGPKWEPSLFNKLCEDVLLFLGLGPFSNQIIRSCGWQLLDKSRTEDPDTLEFCKAVQTRELQLFFEHIMAAPDDSVAA